MDPFTQIASTVILIAIFISTVMFKIILIKRLYVISVITTIISNVASYFVFYITNPGFHWGPVVVVGVFINLNIGLFTAFVVILIIKNLELR